MSLRNDHLLRRRPRDVALGLLAVIGLAVGPATVAAAAPPGDSLDLTSSGTAIVHRQDETTVSPGVRLTEFTRYEAAGWLRGAVLEIDLENPAISIDYLHPGAVAGNKTVLDMVEEEGAFAGVNGDFFDINNSGAANGIGVDAEDGIVKSPVPGHNNALVIDSRGLGHITEVFLEGTAVINGGESRMPLTGVNTSNFPGDGVAVFNSEWGTYARANNLPDRAGAVEVWIDASSSVITTAQPVGEGEIPASVRVIVAPAGPLADQLRGLDAGDTVQTSYSVRSDADRAVVAVGGQAGQTLVGDGEVRTFGDKSVHPRTAVGLDDGGTRLILAAVDGRTTLSRGLSLDELAVFMRDLGADNALNLDGGGSTTLVSQEPGEDGAEVINSPSDGVEREDANGLGVIVEKGSGVVQAYTVRPALAADDAARVFPGLHRPLEALGYDENHHAVASPAEAWTSSDEAVATVTDGVLTAVAPGRTTVTAAAGDATGQLGVHVLGDLARIEATRSVLAMPSPEAVAQLGVIGYDARGFSAPIDAADVTVTGADGLLSLEAGSASTFDVSALVETGSANLTLAVGDAEAEVSVLIGVNDVAVTTFDDAASWYTAGARSTNVLAPGEGRDGSGLAMTIGFDEQSGTRTANMYPSTDLSFFEPFDGQLQEVGAWFKGDGDGNPATYFTLIDADGRAQYIYGPRVEGTEWQYISVPVPQTLASPVRFRSLALYESAAANQYRTTVQVDDVQAVVAPLAEAPQVERFHDAAVVPAGATDDAPLRVAVMSDAQFVARNPTSPAVAGAREALQEIVAANPDVLVINGDFVDEAAPEDFDLARAILDEELAAADFPWYYVPGNHEVMAGPIDNFIAEFGPTHQHFDMDGTRFITLNTATGTLGSEFAQVAMLRAQLDAAAVDPAISGVLVFGHHPTRDFLPTAASQLSDRQEAAMLEDWLSDFRESSGKSTAYIGSHVGAFSARSQDGVVHLINGNSGKSPSSTPDNGGFTGWSMLGVDPAQGAWASAAGEWLDVEIMARVASIEITAPASITGTDFAVVTATLTQDDTREVPVQWPVSAAWAGSDGVHVGTAGSAPTDALVALDPVTGLLSSLDRRWDGEALVPAAPEQELTDVVRTEDVEISVTVNGVTATHAIAVAVPALAEPEPEPTEEPTTEEPSDEPTEEPTTEEPTEEPTTEEPTEEPTTEEPTEEPTTEEPTEEPTTEEPTDEPTTEEPSEEPTDEPGPARVSLSARSVAVGGELVVTAQGFLPDEQVEIELLGGGVLAAVATDDNGIVSATVRIPAGTPVGEHVLAVTGLASGLVAEVELTVTAATSPGGDPTGGADDDGVSGDGTDGVSGDGTAGGGGSLPSTGAPVEALAGGALVLLLAGLMVGVVRRTRATPLS
ncbi:phosphodiester glycosidase family protein [Georgenia wangjunii]|uniref:phosphodiester glycosidase family protein n=1 Tax=Georgenia wangjunii TaxID=3117730 RepID=UPI002F2656F8